MRAGGLVLCGGRSTRMGLPKESLPFGNESMLERVVRLLSSVVRPVVVVAAPGQSLPTLPADIQVARDQQQGRGPMAGLQAGLAAIAEHADAVYATSCDVPLLVPEFVQRLLDLLGEHQIVVPVEGGFHHPLAAVYRTAVAKHVQQLLDGDRLRPVYLFDRVATRRVAVDDLREVDPQLRTLKNLNQPSDYLAALASLGVTAPREIREIIEQSRG